MILEFELEDRPFVWAEMKLFVRQEEGLDFIGNCPGQLAKLLAHKWLRGI